MVHQEVILIAGPSALSEVRQLLDQVADTSSEPRDTGYLVTVPDALMGAFPSDLINEPGLDELESYGFLIDIEGNGRIGWAKRYFDAMDTRGWRLLWLRDGSRVVDRREPTAA